MLSVGPSSKRDRKVGDEKVADAVAETNVTAAFAYAAKWFIIGFLGVDLDGAEIDCEAEKTIAATHNLL